jgi:peptidoglycan/LPS O-acetylase OafA/YrhL
MNERFAWLDATRGIAVLMVMAAHTLDKFWPNYADFVHLGNSGVILFFLCSGYIIPRSIERLSLSDFWIRRFFRLYPLYWVSILLFLLLGMSATYKLTDIFANFTMLQTYLLAPHVAAIFWSLTVEMMFYFLSSIFCIFKIQQKTIENFLAIVFLAFILRETNSIATYFFEYMPIFLLGTVVYCYETRKYSATILYLALSITVVYMVTADTSWNWKSGWLLAISVFLVMYRFRQYRWPSWLTWCGIVSYSIYLLHRIPLYFSPYAVPLAFLIAAVSYKYIEKPFVALGHRLTRKSHQSSKAETWQSDIPPQTQP